MCTRHGFLRGFDIVRGSLLRKFCLEGSPLWKDAVRAMNRDGRCLTPALGRGPPTSLSTGQIDRARRLVDANIHKQSSLDNARHRRLQPRPGGERPELRVVRRFELRQPRARHALAAGPRPVPGAVEGTPRHEVLGHGDRII